MSDRWSEEHGLRIFRCPDASYYGDETAAAADVHTPEALAAIASHGFNGVWLRGKLRDLMSCSLLPELNDPQAPRRLASLRQVIENGRAAGVGVYLFFNDPLALAHDAPFWQQHPELAGEPHREWDGRQVVALCLSHPVVGEWFKQAVKSVVDALPGLAGVILITASEDHSHCWSHRSRIDLGDSFVTRATKPMQCERCAKREPAELVDQIARAWRRAADDAGSPCRVIAWNWSWSIWYPDPQRQVIDALPAGVDVMADWERGGQRQWLGRTQIIDEYSLGYIGPGERFIGCQAAAQATGHHVLARLQINTTHEMATVPNLPLLTHLHAKLRQMHQRGVKGFMGTWNFGTSLTLNTHAVQLFQQDPQRYSDESVFLDALARAHFGDVDTARLSRAWQAFGDAFELYPFHLRMLYFSPINDGPAHPLSLDYHAKPLGDSFLPHAMGDRIEDCLGDMSMQQVICALQGMCTRWQEGLEDYVAALPRGGDPMQSLARQQELGVAHLVGIQLRSALHQFQFHQRRMELMTEHQLIAPCQLPVDRVLLDVMAAEVANVREALPWVKADSRLGYHQEARVHMYDAEQIHAKIAAMQAQLMTAGVPVSAAV